MRKVMVVRYLGALLLASFIQVAMATDAPASSDPAAQTLAPGFTQSMLAGLNCPDTAISASCSKQFSGDTDKLTACLNDHHAYDRCQDNNPDSCNNKKDVFNKAYRKFKASCDLMEGGGADCAKDLHSCEHVSSSDDSKKKSDSDSDDKDNDPLDVTDGAEKAGLCVTDGADIDDVRKQLRDSQKDVDKAKEKLTKIQDDETKIQSDLAEKTNKNNEKIAEAQTEYTEKMTQNNADAQQKLKQMRDDQTSKMNQFQTQLNAAYSSIGDLAVQKEDAHASMVDDKSVDDLIKCKEEAAKEVAERRARLMDKISAGTGTLGGFTSMIRSAGLTDRASDMILTRRLTNACMNDITVINHSRLAVEHYKVAAHGIDQKRDALRTQIATSIQQQNQQVIQNAQDSAEQSGLSQQAQQAALAKMQTKTQSIGQSIAQDNQSASLAMQSKEQEKTLANQSISEAQKFMDDYQTLLTKKEKAAHGNESITAKQVDALRDAYGEAQAAAAALDSPLSTVDKNATPAGKKCCDDDSTTPCNDQRKFLADTADATPDGVVSPDPVDPPTNK